MKYLITIFICTICCGKTLGQNQYNIWYWGGDRDSINNSINSAGIDFNQSSPVALNDCQMNYTEGCAVHCNQLGQLRCYTNGDSVWDRNHNVMPFGALGVPGLITSSRQNSLFIPSDLDSNQLYLFVNSGIPTSSQTGTMGYFQIDLSANGGLGDVVGPFQPLLTGTTEQMIGIKHANGRDHWVITHLFNTNTFYAFHVTPCGIKDTVVSNIGPASNGWGTSSATIFLKASPKADKIAYHMRVNVPNTSTNTWSLLYDFDPENGVLFNNVVLDSSDQNVTTGCSFSPDGSKVYFSGSYPNIGWSIIQYDLNASDITASRTTIAQAPFSGGLFYDMQIGRDSNLYVTNVRIFQEYDTCHVILDPNLPGLACNFDSTGFPLNGDEPGISFPNLITDYLDPLPIVDPNLSISEDSTSCSDSMRVWFSSQISFPGFIDSTGYSYSWDFGDPLSGPFNNVPGRVVSHTFSSQDTFFVTFSATDGCRTFSTTTLVNCPLINQIPEIPDFTVSPTPARSSLYITGKDLERIELYDFTGKKLKAVAVRGAKTRIDISDFSGMLIVKVFATDGRFASRLVPVED